MLKDVFHNTIYCPVCATGREKPRLRIPFARISGLGLLWGVALGALASIRFGPWTGGVLGTVAALLSFLALEVYYSVKFRRELECPVCHFDPLLFRRSPEEAKKKCLEGLRTKEPAFMARLRALQRRQVTEGS